MKYIIICYFREQWISIVEYFNFIVSLVFQGLNSLIDYSALFSIWKGDKKRKNKKGFVYCLFALIYCTARNQAYWIIYTDFFFSFIFFHKHPHFYFSFLIADILLSLDSPKSSFIKEKLKG